MEVYVARQPIFDRRMHVYGYELLYRRSEENYFNSMDDRQATAEVINNAFLVIHLHDLTDGTRAFINFSEELVVEEIPLLLPQNTVVVELLEQVQPTEEVLHACRVLRKNGYLIALDDYAFDPHYAPLLEVADIVKVEFASIDPEQLRRQVRDYKLRYPVQFLAEKIETREQQLLAFELGFDLFQGYFYSKPVIVKGKQIGELRSNVVSVVHELEKEEPDYDVLADMIGKDLSLSYKLLRAANSAAFGSRHRIYSIRQALVRFGVNEMKKWMYLMLLQDKRTIENAELIKASLIRGRFMELLAPALGVAHTDFECFLTGIFSSIDTLLHRDMDDVIGELPLTYATRAALHGTDNALRQLLDIAVCLEQANWGKLECHPLLDDVSKETMMPLYIKSLQWVMGLND